MFQITHTTKGNSKTDNKIEAWLRGCFIYLQDIPNPYHNSGL